MKRISLFLGLCMKTNYLLFFFVIFSFSSFAIDYKYCNDSLDLIFATYDGLIDNIKIPEKGFINVSDKGLYTDHPEEFSKISTELGSHLFKRDENVIKFNEDFWELYSKDQIVAISRSKTDYVKEEIENGRVKRIETKRFIIELAYVDNKCIVNRVSYDKSQPVSVEKKVKFYVDFLSCKLFDDFSIQYDKDMKLCARTETERLGLSDRWSLFEEEPIQDNVKTKMQKRCPKIAKEVYLRLVALKKDLLDRYKDNPPISSSFFNFPTEQRNIGVDTIDEDVESYIRTYEDLTKGQCSSSDDLPYNLFKYVSSRNMCHSAYTGDMLRDPALTKSNKLIFSFPRESSMGKKKETNSSQK